MRIAICDDEQEQRAYLKESTLAWAEKNHITPLLREYDSAEAFSADWQPYEYHFDVILLDIQFGGAKHENPAAQDGISLARQIRETDQRLKIIFITGYEDFISLGYEVSALHYLVKPVSAEKLEGVLDRAAAQLIRPPRILVFDAVDGIVRLHADDILYAEMFSHYAEIHSLDKTVKVKTTMQDLITLLGEGFFRCHRSYIAGMAHVEKITRTDLCLDNGKPLPLSRKLYGDAYRAFNAYYFKFSHDRQ